MGKTITAGFISDTINGIGINSSIKCNNDNLNNNTSRSVAYVFLFLSFPAVDPFRITTYHSTDFVYLSHPYFPSMEI